MVVVTGEKIEQTQSKVDNRGKCCTMMGYSSKYPSSTYRFYNPKTGKIMMLRDVRWLDKTYRSWKTGRVDYMSDSSEESGIGYIENDK